MLEMIAMFFLLLGAAFGLIAAIGIVRLPDLMYRMHAATKAASFGVALLLLGSVLAHPSLRAAIVAVFIVLLIFLTAPLAAQKIGRAGTRTGAMGTAVPDPVSSPDTPGSRSGGERR